MDTRDEAKAAAEELQESLDEGDLKNAKRKAKQILALLNQLSKTEAVFISDDDVLWVIQTHPGIHIKGIRDFLELWDEDPECWGVWNAVERLEAHKKIRTNKEKFRRCCWAIPLSRT